MEQQASAIGRKIRELREAKSWSQTHLAEASRLDPRTVRRIENGETEPSGESLLCICAALDYDSERLKTETKAAAKPKAKVQVVFFTDGQGLLNALCGAHQCQTDIDDPGDDEVVANLVKEVLQTVELAEILPELSAAEVFDHARSLTSTLKDLEARRWSVAVTRKIGAVVARAAGTDGYGAIQIPDWLTVTLMIKKLPEGISA